VEAVYFVEKNDKASLLAHLYEELPMARTIVFTRTKRGADRVVKRLHASGIRAEAIHGDKSQNARERALYSFKANKTPILVATDIASRGIDVDGITHVVNYDLTHEPETYVHRIGRTARAGASGMAVSFCDPEEAPNLKAIEKLLKRRLPVVGEHAFRSNAAASAAAPRTGHRDDRQNGRQSDSHRAPRQFDGDRMPRRQDDRSPRAAAPHTAHPSPSRSEAPSHSRSEHASHGASRPAALRNDSPRASHPLARPARPAHAQAHSHNPSHSHAPAQASSGAHSHPAGRPAMKARRPAGAKRAY